MEDLTSLFLFTQALGALIGACTAVWAEFAYVRAMRDGKISKAERIHLRHLWHGLYFGMTLMLLSMLGIVLAAYVHQALVQPALTSAYWILAVFTLFIIGIAWALAQGHMPFAFGSSLIFSAWWFLAYFTGGWLPTLTFGAAVAFYTVVAAVHYLILKHARFLILRKT